MIKDTTVIQGVDLAKGQDMTVIADTSFPKIKEIFIIHRNEKYGDCASCWEPMDLKVNLRTKEQILVCSNDSITCDYKVKLKDIKFEI